MTWLNRLALLSSLWVPAPVPALAQAVPSRPPVAVSARPAAAAPQDSGKPAPIDGPVLRVLPGATPDDADVGIEDGPAAGHPVPIGELRGCECFG